METVNAVELDGAISGYLTSTSTKRASNAAGRICNDSSFGVMEGRESSFGITASSKTSPRPVCCNSLEDNLGRNVLSVSRPRTRIAVVGVSRRVSKGGMNIFQ